MRRDKWRREIHCRHRKIENCSQRMQETGDRRRKMGTRRVFTLRGTLEKFSSHLPKTEFNYECGEKRGKGNVFD